MHVNIGEFNSTFQVTDSRALGTQSLSEQDRLALFAGFRTEQERERRQYEETSIRNSVAVDGVDGRV